jgi:hypothetical protein
MSFSQMIPNSQVVIRYSEKHSLVVTNVQTLLSLNIVNWKRNRPAEIQRCEEIAADILLRKPVLDSMFYFHSVTEKTGLSKFECLDGIHRYTALTLLHKECIKPLDLLHSDDTSNVKESMDWLYKRTVLLNIRVGYTDEELTEIFRNINNCVPVPITYLEEFDERKRKCVETVAAHLQMLYRSHFVVEKNAQHKPNRPNTTRTRVVNMITELYDSLKNEDIEDTEILHIIQRWIENANLYIQNHLIIGISPSILEKCRKTGCYLFLYKPCEILKIIDRLRSGLVIA